VFGGDEGNVVECSRERRSRADELSGAAGGECLFVDFSRGPSRRCVCSEVVRDGGRDWDERRRLRWRPGVKTAKSETAAYEEEMNTAA